MKCLETRKRDGMTWRRYRTTDGRIVTTFELPTQVLRGVTTPARVQTRLAAWRHGQEMEALNWRVRFLLTVGWKPEAISAETGMTTRSVQRIRRAMEASMNASSPTAESPPAKAKKPDAGSGPET